MLPDTAVGKITPSQDEGLGDIQRVQGATLAPGSAEENDVSLYCSERWKLLFCFIVTDEKLPQSQTIGYQNLMLYFPLLDRV